MVANRITIFLGRAFKERSGTTDYGYGDKNARKFTSGLREWDKTQVRLAAQAQANNQAHPTPNWEFFQIHIRTV